MSTKDTEIICPEASDFWSIYSSTCLGSKERKKSQNCEVNQSKSILDGRFVLILSLPCPISSPTASTRGGRSLGERRKDCPSVRCMSLCMYICMSLGERRKVTRTVPVSDVFSLRSHGHQNRKASETKQRQSTWQRIGKNIKHYAPFHPLSWFPPRISLVFCQNITFEEWRGD